MTLSMRATTAALLAVLSVAGPAAAQKMTPAEAKAEFKEAQELYQADRCKDALPRFEKLARATDSPNAKLYVARCLRKLDRIPEAYEAFSAVIRAADAKSREDERYADTRSAAAAERAAVESKVARVVIAMANVPAGLEVRIGSLDIDAEHIGEPIAVKPGQLEISATAPGHKPFNRSLDVAGGSLSTVTMALETAGGKPGAGAPSGGAAASDPGVDDAPTSLTLAYVALGVGAAGLATFGVAGYLADQRFNSLEEDCAGGPCPPEKRSEIDGGRRLDTIANIGLIVGGVGVVSGAALLLFGGSKETARPATVAFVSPSVGGGNLVVTGRF